MVCAFPAAVTFERRSAAGTAIPAMTTAAARKARSLTRPAPSNPAPRPLNPAGLGQSAGSARVPIQADAFAMAAFWHGYAAREGFSPVLNTSQSRLRMPTRLNPMCGSLAVW